MTEIVKLQKLRREKSCVTPSFAKETYKHENVFASPNVIFDRVNLLLTS